MSTRQEKTDWEKIEFVANLFTPSLDDEKTSLIDVRYSIDASIRFHWMTEHGKGVDPVRAARAILKEKSAEEVSQRSQRWLWWITTTLFCLLSLVGAATSDPKAALPVAVVNITCLVIFWVFEGRSDQCRNSCAIQTDPKPVIEFYDWAKKITDGIRRVAKDYSIHNSLSLLLDRMRQFARDSLIYQAGDVLIANHIRDKNPYGIEAIRLATETSESFESNYGVLVHECHLVKDNKGVLFEKARELPDVKEVVEKKPTSESVATT